MSTARRSFLRDALGLGAAIAIGGGARAAEKKEEDVSPTEDLMREHGVLRRILLIYGEAIRRIEASQKLEPEPIAHAAQIVRAFIEDYHERDEEEFIFPRFRKAGKLTDLVDVLIAQHQAGRKLTASIQRLANATGNRRELAESMRQFIRMYEPHSAREDTVLFPAFAELVSEKELHQLMELFERKEHALPLGDFEKMVADVAAIEKSLAIHDLALFTPR
jgi:hemerythrin-like domain-containing protein